MNLQRRAFAARCVGWALAARAGLADGAVALSRLSGALRGADAAALLKAASALKPPYASCAFTAFGAAEGERIAP
jgi:hypothetical protein